MSRKAGAQVGIKNLIRIITAADAHGFMRLIVVHRIRAM